MIKIRYSSERGYFDYNWLKTRHTFSFDQYYDPNYMGFRTLRVINQDIIAPGQGFATHSHKNMEIITFVITGAVIHKDSMGSEAVIRTGEIQRMSAGKGVRHSEYNYSNNELLELIQIWILPDQANIESSYEQKKYIEIPNDLTLLASPTGEKNSVSIHQSDYLSLGVLSTGYSKSINLAKDRYGWIQMLAGELNANGQTLLSGDGAAISDENQLNLIAKQNAKFLFFDLS